LESTRIALFLPSTWRSRILLTGSLTTFFLRFASWGVPLGKVAVLASWWVSLFNLARELRNQGIPVIGPGARPYRRSHLIAPFVETVGAYLECPDCEIAVAVQRALFALLAEVEEEAPRRIFDFKGRVVVCKLLAEAANIRNTVTTAAEWIIDATKAGANLLLEQEMISAEGADTLRESEARWRPISGAGTAVIHSKLKSRLVDQRMVKLFHCASIGLKLSVIVAAYG
jgi:hypothetical protein